MREIKFRAWDGESMMLWEDIKDVWQLSIFEYFVGVEIMQFTGLKDKNGKEIYEGDIVRFKRYKTKEAILLVRELSHLGLFLTYIHPYTTGIFWNQLSQIDTCEVIGNKFENPELLK